MKKRLALLLVALASLVLLAGCGGTLDTLLQGGGSNIDSWVGTSNNNNATASSSAGSGGEQSVELYFADSTGKYLVKEKRTIPTTLSMARETINQWLKGPAVKGGNTQAAISPSTTLKDVNLKDGVLTIDLSKEFTTAYNNVSQRVSVYGLVNTMTQFSTIKEVHLRIEGEALNTLGDLDLSHLVYNESLVKDDQAQTTPADTQSQSGTETGSGSGTNSSNSSSSGNSSSSSSSSSSSPSTLNLFSSPGGTT